MVSFLLVFYIKPEMRGGGRLGVLYDYYDNLDDDAHDYDDDVTLFNYLQIIVR